MIFFDVWHNKTHDTGLSQVRFGAGQEILEIELNEMQTLADLKLAKVVTALAGNCYIDGSISVNDGNLVITGGYVFIGGRIAQINSAYVPVTANQRYVLRIYQRVVTEQDALRETGNRAGDVVENHIIDPRYSQPLSRRIQWEWALESISLTEVINESCNIDILNPLGTTPTTATPTLVIATSGEISSTPPTINDITINNNKAINRALNSVELSDVEVPNFGVRTHYRIIKEVSGYVPFRPGVPEIPEQPEPPSEPETVHGLLDVDGLGVRDALLQLDNGDIVPLALQIGQEVSE